MNVKRWSLSSALCLFLSGISVGAIAMEYPRNQVYPTPMCNPSVPCNFFKTQTTNDADGQSYYPDGTLTSNPVIDNGQINIDGNLYLIKKLQYNDSIQFLGKNYVVTSAIPLDMTIDYAYQHTAQYYSAKEVQAHQIDITIPQQLNNGQPTSSLQLEPSVVHADGENGQPVYTFNTGFYIPNLPNNNDNYPYISGPMTADLKKHDGLTANVYWTVDAWMGNSQAIDQPGGKNYHMIGYGWALDSRDVAQQLFIQELNKDGGSIYGPPKTVAIFAPPFNSWMVLMNKDYQDPNTKKNNYDNYIGQISTWLDQANIYPFPVPKDNKGDYWLKHGIYLPIQPMPGFQRNLVRWYTPWGAWNLVNNTSGLFMRNDGRVELPINPKDNQPYPIVTQTWDGNQTFTVINQTHSIISSTYDSYPGSEVYFAGNAFLPGNDTEGTAGVITAYHDYTVFDSTGTFDPRQTDLWLGMKGSTPKDVMAWDDADDSEPGGQAAKPYMVGADISHRGGKLMYTIRIQTSNSQPIAILPKSASEKVYSTTLYVDPNGTGNYQKIGTLNYTWQNWRINNNGQWEDNSGSPDKGALVPSIEIDASNEKNFQDWGVSIETVKESGWHPSSRTMDWTESLYQNEANAVGTPVYTFKLTASIANPKSRFVMLLSNEVSHQTLTAPTNLQSADVTDKTATVSWTAAVDSASEHTPITYTAVAKSGTQSVNGVVNATTAQFSGLQPNTTYTVTVTAQDTVAGANQTASANLNVMTKQGTGPTENKYRIIVGNATLLYYQIADGALQSVKGDGSDAAVIPLPSKTPIVVFNSTKAISCNIIFDSALPSGYSVTKNGDDKGLCTTGNITLHLGTTENQLIFPAWG